MSETISHSATLKNYLLGLTYLYAQAKEDNHLEVADILHDAIQTLTAWITTNYIPRHASTKHASNAQQVADLFLQVASLSQHDMHKLIYLLENESMLIEHGQRLH